MKPRWRTPSLSLYAGPCVNLQRQHEPTGLSAPDNGCRRDHFRGPVRGQLRAPPERHDAGAAARHLPDAEVGLSPQFRANRLRHLRVPVHGLAAPASGGARRRQKAHALFARHGHGFHADRASGALGCAQLRDDHRVRRFRGPWILGVPSGILARCAHGSRRPSRARPIDFPARRQYRLGARTVHRGFHRARLGPEEHRLVFVGCVRGDRYPVERRPVVPLARACAHPRRAKIPFGGFVIARESAPHDRHPARADLFEIRVSHEHRQLLHLLSDPEIPSLGARRSCTCSCSSRPLRWARCSAAPSATVSDGNT